jgi:hypothetical protein
MTTPLTKPEKYVLLFLIALTGFGLFLPAIHQLESYHHFADQRTWGVIPNFSDVFSNLIFIAVGAAGLYRLASLPPALQKTRLPLSIFFIGLLLIGPGSAYYHWAPDSQTILVDRLPMVLAFAGVVATFLTQRVSARIGLTGLAAGLILGAAGLITSSMTGNLALYVMLQFGGLTGLVVGLLVLRNDDDIFPWWSLIGWYALAKALELGDHAVWEFTQHVVSGHTLKHIAAGMSGVVLLRALFACETKPVSVCSSSRRQCADGNPPFLIHPD